MPQVQEKYYLSPPGSNGNNGALPQVYDPAWQSYTNLTQAQIAAFTSFPQFLNWYAGQQRWAAEVSGTTVTYNAVSIPLTTDDRSKILIIGMRQAIDDGMISTVTFKDADGAAHTLDLNGIKAVHGAVMALVQALFGAEAAVSAGINATPQTITKPSQVDAIFAPLAPNSPSATNPGSGLA